MAKKAKKPRPAKKAKTPKKPTAPKNTFRKRALKAAPGDPAFENDD